MKKSLLTAAFLLTNVALFAQEITIQPSLDENGNPQFTFSPDESYFLIQLEDEQKNEAISLYGLSESNFLWMGADSDHGRNIWSWSNTIVWEDSSADNCFGGLGGYQAWRVANGVGWSGLGYNVSKDFPMDLHWIDSDYALHIALRTNTTQSIDLYLTDGNKTEAHLVFGQSAYDGKVAIGDFPRDGKWYDIDIPMTWLEDQFEFTFDGATEYGNFNYLCALIGKKPGEGIDFGACFFHGPKCPATSVLVNDDATAIQAPEGLFDNQYPSPNAKRYNLLGQPIGSQQRVVGIVKRNNTWQKTIK